MTENANHGFLSSYDSLSVGSIAALLNHSLVVEIKVHLLVFPCMALS